MNEEIEIEAKSLISKEAYHALIHKFGLTVDDAITQHNHYFETEDFSLRKAQAALRIREKRLTYTFTLKQPHHVGLLETNQTITKLQTENAISKHQIPYGNVYKALVVLHIPIAKLKYIGTLTTERIELPFSDGLICLDKSTYANHVDYEIEFEGSSVEHAETTLQNVLASINVEVQRAKSKTNRFLDSRDNERC